MASFDTVNTNMEGKEEDFVVSRSSKSDTKFDNVIGHIEDIIMEDEFQTLQSNFMDKYYEEFEDADENKLCYTDIHKQYTELIERFISDQLSQRMSGFVMEEFQKQLISRKKELEGEVFEMLVTFSDFLAFKEMMLDYRAEKEGRTIDLSSGFTVTSLGASDANGVGLGLGIGGTGLGPQASGPGVGNRINLMDSEEAMVEGGNTPRLDCGEPVTAGSHSNVPGPINGLKVDPGAEQMDTAMETPQQ